MKTLSKFFAIVTVVAAFAACEDVPMPYEINEPAGGGKTLPYSTVAPKAGWTMLGIDNLSNPWSAGSDYTQATGYQKWDGASAKTNREVSGVLVSPAFNTAAKSGKIKISIDYCIAYAKNDASYKDHVIVYVAKGADVKKFDKAEWTALSWKPTFESSDWTLKTEEIQVPDSFANQKDVRIAFWFYAPESGSTTFEIKNFIFEEGVAGQSSDEQSTKEKPLSVAQAQGAKGNQYVKGYIVGYVDGQNYEDSCVFAVPTAAQTEILIADSPQETSCNNCMPVQLPAGALRTALELSAHPDFFKKEVTVYGSVETYFKVPGVKNTSWASINGSTYGKDPDASEEIKGEPKGDGTAANPYNTAGILKFAQGGNYTNDKPSETVYVKGIVSNVESFQEKYGEINYFISDDGKATGDQFYVYGGLGLGGQKFAAQSDLAVGNEVVVAGQVVVYNGTVEFKYGSKIVKLNGKGEEGGDKEEGDEPDPTPITGNNLLENGGFELWSGNVPTNWKSACTASSATLAQSSDAHSGSYAVNVNGDASSNKRLAYKEITLPAGKYTFSFYAKATSANKAQVRPGYVPLTDGKVGNYAYGDYATLSTDWTLVSYSFELKESTTLCLVVMNPKASSYSSGEDVLVDDAQLVGTGTAAVKKQAIRR